MFISVGIRMFLKIKEQAQCIEVRGMWLCVNLPVNIYVCMGEGLNTEFRKVLSMLVVKCSN